MLLQIYSILNWRREWQSTPWRIPWTDRLQSMGSQKSPLHGESHGQATVHGVAKESGD